MRHPLGIIDYRDELFVARFPFDAAIVAELKTLKLGDRQKSSDEWAILRHRPSVARLLRIGRDHRWAFTSEAKRAIEELQAEAEAAEFSIDIIDGSASEPWFRCVLGGDDELKRRVMAVPGACEDDDCCSVPATREDACAALLAIAQDDDRLEVSEKAWRLLHEPDLSFDLPRSATMSTVHEGQEVDDDGNLLGGTWEPTPLDFETLTLSRATEEPDFKVAASLRGSLLPFQVAGVRYLCSAPHALLADDVGLGKTVQALAAIETLGAYPALVLCPAALQQNWLREAQRWLPKDKTISALDDAFEYVPLVDVAIVSYEGLTRQHLLLRERGFEAIVADESHLLRNRDAARTQAAIEVAASVPSLRLCLSSLPSKPNRPIDLAGQLDFLGVLESEFGGFWNFASRYCAPKHDGSELRFGVARSDELVQRLRSTCYCARSHAAVETQLPSPRRAVHWLGLKERQGYDATEADARAILRAVSAAEDQDSPESHGYGGRAEARRQQQLSQVRRVMDACAAQKAPTVARWIANFLSRGQSLVVFARHPELAGALLERFPRALAMRGGDSLMQRNKVLRAFQSGEAPLLVCSLHTAELSLGSMRTAHVAFAEIGWSAGPRAAGEGELQIHRIGQERNAMEWYLLGDGTIDELVLDVIERKHVMAGQLHDSVLLELAKQIARMTEPPPPSSDGSPPALRNPAQLLG